MKTRDKKIIPMGDSTLPPAGYERTEELARRTDELEEVGEKLANEQELYAIAPEAPAMQPDRELMNLFDPGAMSMLTVSNPQPGWRYAWANRVNQSGLQVMMKKYDGWQVVSGNDKESLEHKSVDGTRCIADVLLMKLPEAQGKKLDQREATRRDRQQRGVAAELEALGHKYRDKGLKVHTPNTGTSQHGFVRSEQTLDPRRAAVVQEAGRQLGEMSRTQIPGVPIPGKTQ